MRVMPSRYTTKAQPVMVKGRPPGKVKHLSAPLKGLSLSSKLVAGDPLTAPVLDNWIVEEHRIVSRGGTKLTVTLPGSAPVRALIPYYGFPEQLAVATNGKLYNLDGTVLKEPFTSDDWHWTAFSNLSDQDFTVMVNGFSGVWSWDGQVAPVKETVTAPAGTTHIFPDKFNIVLSHMNRLWFADTTRLSVYYLPLQQKSGEVKELPLNAVFKRGGTVRAMATWTVDGGMGLDDQLVIFSSNGEAAIYNGTDPDNDMSLTGVYRFDAPMSKHSVQQHGGELYVLVSTGLVPMSQMMRAESENLGKVDKNVYSEFAFQSYRNRDREGWQVLLDHGTGRMICNLPTGGLNNYKQLVRFMPNPVWASWSALAARTWGWIDNRVYFGTDDGRVYELNSLYLSDDGLPIRLDVQGAWSAYGTPAIKHFRMILPYIYSDGSPHPLIDIKVDYDLTPPTNEPEVSPGAIGAVWDVATWDEDYWASALARRSNWTGVGRMGRVGAPRLVARIIDCEFALTGFDVIYESGSALG